MCRCACMRRLCCWSAWGWLDPACGSAWSERSGRSRLAFMAALQKHRLHGLTTLKINRELLTEPGLIKATSHTEWPSRGLSFGTPDPHRFACVGRGGRWGPKCLQAHQALPRPGDPQTHSSSKYITVSLSYISICIAETSTGHSSPRRDTLLVPESHHAGDHCTLLPKSRLHVC